MTDAKPDPLEDLVRVIDEIAANPERQSNWIPDLMACLSAWEKERAEFHTRRELLRAGYESVAAHLNALRAAVEKVRDEMRGHVKAMHDQYGAPLENQIVGEWSDALDAALGGGE